MAPPLGSLLLPPLAGALRCFCSGWLIASAARAVKRAGVNASPAHSRSAPFALGAMLATSCLVWHGAVLSLHALGRRRRHALAGGVAGVFACLWWPCEAGLGTDVHAAVVLSAVRVCWHPRTLSRAQSTSSDPVAIGVSSISLWWYLRRYARAAVKAARLSIIGEYVGPIAFATLAPVAEARLRSVSVPDDAEAPQAKSRIGEIRGGLLDAGLGEGGRLGRSVARVESSGRRYLSRIQPPLSSFVLPQIALHAALRPLDPARSPPTLASLAVAAAAGWADGIYLELSQSLPASIIMVRDFMAELPNRQS